MPNSNAARTAPAPASQPDDNLGNKPAERFHLGSVHMSIWEKSGSKGLFRTASFQLRYRDGEEWKTSQSYSLSDLENLENAAHEAHARITKWQQATATTSVPR